LSPLIIIPPAKKPRPKGMRFLDIGFGKAERIASYARRPRSKNRFFMGIEAKKRKGVRVPSRQHNVKLVIGDAVKRMKRLKPKSFNVINIDFVPFLRKEAVGVTGLQTRIEARYVEAMPGLLKEARRVLPEGGRFYITVPFSDALETKVMMEKAGFKQTRADEVPESKMNTTDEMRKHFEYAETDITAMPWRVVGIKRSN
tara:strand:- start:1127 stop:1726 length:600 start_codon:yes stop_codon:yes gene_type:complete